MANATEIRNPTQTGIIEAVDGVLEERGWGEAMRPVLLSQFLAAEVAADPAMGKRLAAFLDDCAEAEDAGDDDEEDEEDDDDDDFDDEETDDLDDDLDDLDDDDAEDDEEKEDEDQGDDDD